MKLTADEKRKLLASCEGQPLESVIDDVCELMTAKVVFWLSGKRRSVRTSRDALPIGHPEANTKAHLMRYLGGLTVELSEKD